MRRNRVKNDARCTAFPREMRRFGARKAIKKGFPAARPYRWFNPILRLKQRAVKALVCELPTAIRKDGAPTLIYFSATLCVEFFL